MKCLQCGKETSNDKFCSCSCSASYNNKRRNHSFYNKHPNVIIICKNCREEKEIDYYHRDQKYCSKHCAMKVNGSMMGKHHNQKGGLREGGGHSKVSKYVSLYAGEIKLNKEEIEVAKVLDLLKISWCRNKKGFGYTNLEGRKHKYYPDFYINNYNCYVEYKGWVTIEMKHKMEEAVSNNNLKLVIIYSNDKRYRDLGLNLQTIQKDPCSLLDKIRLTGVP